MFLRIKFNLNIRKIIYITLFSLILIDLTYSFVQHLNMPLDGDMAGGIVPSNDVKIVLNDPLGLESFTSFEKYPNPNRFFAHYTFYSYFRFVPIYLQSFVSPIESVYLACAIAKILIQIFILIILSLYVKGKTKFKFSQFILVAFLILPLFQNNSYRSNFNIIDPSITYTFFYSLPILLSLIFYFPIFQGKLKNLQPFKNKVLLLCLFSLALFISLNGPLIPGIVLIISLLYLWFFFEYKISQKNTIKVIQNFKLIPISYKILFSIISFFSIYYLFLSSKNSIFSGESITILERYLRIPKGLFLFLTEKNCFPLFVILIIIINVFLLKKYCHDFESKKNLTFFKFILVFSVIYILLLPLGGYINYRPNIIRYDTMLPIIVALIYIYAKTSLSLILYFKNNSKKKYLMLLSVFIMIFTIADGPEFKKNDCEKFNLQKIANSKTNTVHFDTECSVLSWKKSNTFDKNSISGKLLKLWRIE